MNGGSLIQNRIRLCGLFLEFMVYGLMITHIFNVNFNDIIT